MNAQPGPGAGRPGTADRLVVTGGVVFLVGLLALAATLALWGRDGSAPGAAAAAALLCPVGFAISFAGLVVQARGRRDR